MTLYYQILETTDGESVSYTARKAWNFFGYIISIPASDRWLSDHERSSHLFSWGLLAGKFSSLEDVHKRIKDHSNIVMRDKKKRKFTKTKIVETVKITEEK